MFAGDEVEGEVRTRRLEAVTLTATGDGKLVGALPWRALERVFFPGAAAGVAASVAATSPWLR